MEEIKTCTSCKEEKPVSSFHLRRELGEKGRRAICKTCHNQVRKKYIQDNREYHRIVSYKSSLKTRYGLTQEDYDTRKKQQRGRCKICSGKEEEAKRYLCVDHCHKTGRIRGLLCDKCNVGLSRADDSLGRLLKMMVYLLRSRYKWLN